MLAILETGSETGAANPQAAGMKNFFRGMTVLMIPFTAWMPSVSLPFHSVSPYDGNF
jgi:YidC/Oxa1 family membrane protein insertase